MGESEIANLGLGIGIKEDVSGLDVTVNDSALVGVGQATRNGGDHLESNSRVDCPVVG